LEGGTDLRYIQELLGHKSSKKLQKSIPTLASGISDRLKALWILEKDDNNKKLQFEASSRVVHKRSTSQNMQI
jgi:hypothetical protein